jgi:hypothetical protein
LRITPVLGIGSGRSQQIANSAAVAAWGRL